MPLEQFSNAAQTTLSAAVTTTTATSVSVTSSSAFPAIGTGGTQQFRVLVDSEIFIVTAVSGTTWTVIRGAEGTTAATHLVGASVTHVLTAGSLENYSYPFPQIDSSPVYDAAVFSGNTVSLPTSDPLIVSSGNMVALDADGVLRFADTTVPSFGAAGDIGVETFGVSASAGTTGKMADAGHIHQMPAAPSGGTAGTPSLTLSTTNAAGTTGTYVDAGSTIAAFDATAPTTLTSGGAAATGSAGAAARRDHVHGMPTIPAAGSPSLTLGTAAATGAASTFVATDATIVAFDATVPTTISSGAAAAAGSATVAARRDHTHGAPTIPSAGTPGLTLSTTNAAGSGTSYVASNATLALFDATAPSTQAFGDSAAAGSAAVAARRDHKHAMPSDPTVLTILAKTASYTLTATEVNTWVTVSSTSATTITVPSAVFSAGQVIYVQQINTGQVTISGSGTTLTSTGATSTAPKTRARYSSASIICTASNTFTVVGDIA